ncbi:MAG: CehA/McbA family metallohydrolase [Vicinamibacterales bacterium]|nr:CehA/McbA family metallohydrolase [Vicinamibacterales bacterium]
MPTRFAKPPVSRRRTLFVIAAAVLAAAFLFVFSQLPARRLELAKPSWGGPATALGAFHIHTVRSDGSGALDEIAAAASRAGLQFLIFTDHGDGTRPPEEPQYRSGVLCIDAAEISTAAGHYIAIGMQQTPYPLAGEPRDVVEDVRRFGGVGVVAHPDSTKPALQWYDWTVPFDGIEWLNADSEWRNETTQRLGRALVEYPFRAVETLGSLLDRPEETLERWDRLTQDRRVFALAGADAHARLGRQENEAIGFRSGWFVRIPSYDVSFRTFSLRVALDRPFAGDARPDAAQLISAIRQGHVSSSIDALATPAFVDFSASSGNESARAGDHLPYVDGTASLVVRTNAPSDGTIVLRRNGRILAEHAAPELKYASADGRGAYRAEIYLSSSPGQPPVPWLITNPIYVEPADWGRAVLTPVDEATDRWPIQGGPWHIEKDASSTANVVSGSPEDPVELSYQLSGGAKAGQYAALVLSTGNALRGHARLAFQGQAARPMRISVQARHPSRGERWQRSVYLDGTPRDISIPFTEMTPVAPTPAATFDPAAIDTVLFVVDTTNTAPGSAGSFVISELRVEH